MKTLRVGFALLSASLLVLMYSASPKAFHSGGVAECSGCHSMHSPAGNGGNFLLVGTDASSACLTCHQNSGDTGPSSYHISTAVTGTLGTNQVPLQRTPGGDFAWLKKSFTFAGTTETGESHGHNVVAADFGYAVDGHNSTAPGGTFSANKLACNSCHDPHGQFRRNASNVIARTGQPIYASGSYPGTANEPTANESVGVYRLLGGNGYSQRDGGVTFSGAPAAKVPSTYNRTEAATQTRTAYGIASGNGHATWGNWCSTCHPDMHSTASMGTNYVHPVDETLGSTIAANYNSYVKTGDMTGTSANAFTSLVPFAKSGTWADLSALAVNNDSKLDGASSSDHVTCLSCHRAHASGTIHALRFDLEYEFMTKGGQYTGLENPQIVASSRGPTQARGRTIAEWQAHYYDRPATKFATYQRVLCNKCHAKD